MDTITSLLRIISDPTIAPPERAEVGRRLNELSDPRHGVGVKDGLPDIDWVEIPDDGEWIYQETKHPPLPTFYISRYPITYAQFQTFIDDPQGANNPRWYQGMAADESDHPISEQWFKYANHPRERVNWYQAMAFCRWWSWQLVIAEGGQNQGGSGELPALKAIDWMNPLTWPVRLPTEQEWEKAARGTDGRNYPWGDTFISGFANVNEILNKVGSSYLEQTTAVGIYPQSQSPYGVMDMSGNVWEWCLNEYDGLGRIDISKMNRRVLRGGSWYDHSGSARATIRDAGFISHYRSNDGFRVICANPSLY